MGELIPVLAALGISCMATAIIALRLPESRPCEIGPDPEQSNARRVFGQEQKPCYDVRGSDTLTVRQMLRMKHVSPLLAVYFLVMLGFNFYYVAFPVYASEGLLWSVRDVGVYFAVLSFSMVIVQGPVLGRLSRYSTDATLAVAGSLILALSFLFVLSRDSGLLYLGAVLLALGNGLMWPSIVSMLSKAAGDRHQGAVQGFAASSGAVASIAGLLIGGAFYARFQNRLFLGASMIILSVFCITLWLSARLRREVAP